MSVFRRSMMISSGTTYYTKFTVKFVDGSVNNQIVNSTTNSVAYGIGFEYYIGRKGNYNDPVKNPIDVNVKITRNSDNSLIYDKHGTHTNYTSGNNIYGDSQGNIEIFNTTNSPLEDGLYTVEMICKSAGVISLLNVQNSSRIYLTTLETQPQSSGKSYTYYYCKCLYSIEETKPDGILSDKGIANEIEYFVEGE